MTNFGVTFDGIILFLLKLVIILLLGNNYAYLSIWMKL